MDATYAVQHPCPAGFRALACRNIRRLYEHVRCLADGAGRPWRLLHADARLSGGACGPCHRSRPDRGTDTSADAATI